MASALRPRFLVHVAFVALSLLCYTCTTRVEGSLADDANGLTVFKNAVDGQNRLNWSARNVCQWQGIECRTEKSTLRVTSVRLPGQSMSGPIPHGSIGQLTELRVLSLRSNKLYGGLPADFANCSSMRSIYLQRNELSGPLPSNFTLWPNLVHVDLSSNNLSDVIPSSLANLTQLKSLFLQNNSLSGPIPALNITSLTDFSVAYNNLSGPIPATAAFRKFDIDAFTGNSYLCGFPLPPCLNVGALAPSPISAKFNVIIIPGPSWSGVGRGKILAVHSAHNNSRNPAVQPSDVCHLSSPGISSWNGSQPSDV